MVDAAALAKTITLLLSPTIPYLLKGGEQAIGEASKKIGSDAWELAKSIWTKLTSRPKSNKKAEEVTTEIVKAAIEVANNPSDEDAQVSLRFQIKKLLADDPELSRAIAKAIEDSKSSSVHTNIRVGGVDISSGATVNNLGNIVGGNQTISK